MPRLEITRQRAEGQWTVDLAADADPPEPELLAEAIGEVARRGGGQLHWWVSQPTEAHTRTAAVAGFAPRRDLWQMRRPLPVGLPYQLDTRPFEVGRDERAWLAVNNRAFDWHPEQGGWTIDTILEREAQPWFDPAGFLLHERDTQLAGFCWTKVHDDADPPMGEIYAIAVDPDFAGLGLGRALVLAGLDHLATVRTMPVGMLYVDAGNAPAVGLYERLGFERHHVDRDYIADVAPAG